MAGSSDNQMNVSLKLVSKADVEREQLEEHTVQVLEAIDRNAADIALDAVAWCDFDEHAIEVLFQVVAESPSDVSTKVGLVLDAIEQVLDAELLWMGAEAPALACA